MLKLTVFIPESHLEEIKTALFSEGAGQIGDYDCCSWQVKGTGQFRPLAGSSPFLGTKGSVETVDEYRVEMVLHEQVLSEVLKALRNSHPYEEPAFDVVQLMPVKLPQPS